MRQGIGKVEAALLSSRQLLTPIISMTITLAVVYTPIGFLSGLTGALFKEFAFTLAVAVIISGIVAVTLSPIMSAYVSPRGGREGRFTQKVNAGFAYLQRQYRKLLVLVIENRAPVLFLAAFISVLSIPFYLFSLKELAPTEDQSSITVIIESAPEASLEYTTKHMDQVVSTMHTLPGAKFMWQIVRPEGAFGGMDFVPPEERKHSIHELFWQAFNVLSEIVGVKAFPVLDAGLPTAGNFSVELVVMSNESYQDMKPYADQLLAAAYASEIFLFAETDLKLDLPQARIKLNRQRIADMGMDLANVSRQLGTLLSGNFVNRFNRDRRAYKVIPMVEDQYRLSPQAVLDLTIRTPEGEMIPLHSIATLTHETGPRVLSKFQQKNSFRVYGELIPGTTNDQGLAVLEAAATQILPAQYSIDYAGESRQIRAEGSTLEGVLLIALVFVFFVLAIQFNSFRDPLVVLLGSVPLALASALVFTFVDFTTINIYSQIGFITLVGLIAKNAILIVEFANQLQRQGRSKFEAIVAASEIRLRPVLMTTAATVLGHLPLVLVLGAGAAARNSIGIVLVAGMAVGTLFTLLVLPSVYMVIARDRQNSSLTSENIREDRGYPSAIKPAAE